MITKRKTRKSSIVKRDSFNFTPEKAEQMMKEAAAAVENETIQPRR